MTSRAVQLDAAHHVARAAACRRCTSCRTATGRAPRRSRRSCARPSRASRRTASRSVRRPGRTRPAVIGPQPRSAPIRSRIRFMCGHSSSRASSSVSATWPGECTPTGSAGSVELRQRAVVQVDERREAGALAADDREHQRQAVVRGAHHRLRAAADADPRRRAGRTRCAGTPAGRAAARGCCRPRHRLLLAAAARTGRASPRTAPRTARARSRTAGTTR